MAKQFALWVNDMPLSCGYYISVAVLCVFFTTLKGTQDWAQMLVYSGFLGLAALELMLRHTVELQDSFDLPVIGPFGELTRFEKAMTFRVCFLWCTLAVMVISSLSGSATEIDTTKSYF